MPRKTKLQLLIGMQNYTAMAAFQPFTELNPTAGSL